MMKQKLVILGLVENITSLAYNANCLCFHAFVTLETIKT